MGGDERAACDVDMDGVVADDGERLGIELFLEDDGAEDRIDVTGWAFAF